MRAPILQPVNNSKVETNGRRLTPEAFARRVDGLMSTLCQAMVHHEQNYLTRGELTMPQFWALEWMSRTKRGRMQDLVAALQLKSSTGTMLVDRLVTLGLARRVRNPDDRRSVALALTARGARVVDEVHRQRQRGIRRMFAPLSVRERKEYLALLEKLAREFSKEQA